MLSFFLQAFSLGLSAAASPGPYQAFLIGQSLKNGWRRTLPAVLAPLISDGPIILVMLFALTQLPAGVLAAIQIAGGAYVIYLAWKSFQAFRTFDYVAPAGDTRKTFWQAVATNFLSPGPYIFWSLLAGPVLVRAWQQAPIAGLVFLFGFYAAFIGGLALIVIVFGAARQLGAQVSRALLGISALALFGFGLVQLWQGVRGLA